MMYEALSALGIENEEFSFKLRESYRDYQSLFQFLEEGGPFCSVVFNTMLDSLLRKKLIEVYATTGSYGQT